MKIFFSGSLLLFLLPWQAQARIFDLNRFTLASTLVYSAASTRLSNMPMHGMSTATSFAEEYKLPTSYEFGMVYSDGFYGFRFGFEVIKPAGIAGDAKSNSATLYHYDNNLLATAFKLGLDINFYNTNSYRVGAFGYYGNATLTDTTVYSSVNVAPNVNHTVETKASAPVYAGGMFAEFAAFDTTTFIIEVSYRSLKFSALKYNADVTSFDGAKEKGGVVQNLDGTDHEIDFTGVVAAVGIRIYLF